MILAGTAAMLVACAAFSSARAQQPSEGLPPEALNRACYAFRAAAISANFDVETPLITTSGREDIYQTTFLYAVVLLEQQKRQLPSVTPELVHEVLQQLNQGADTTVEHMQDGNENFLQMVRTTNSNCKAYAEDKLDFVRQMFAPH